MRGGTVKRSKKGFTLAEMVITLTVMAIVLALVVGFTVAITNSTSKRTETTATIEEIKKAEDMIRDWFYSFDTSENTVVKVENKSSAVADIINDTVVYKPYSRVVIRNKNYLSLLEQDGIVTPKYTLTFENGVLTAFNGRAEDNKNAAFEYITGMEFSWDEELDVLKCVMKYQMTDTDVMEHSVIIRKNANG